jgi:predicted nucleotidyltransferase
MSKAIAEMTPQELKRYNPAQNLHRSLDRDRWGKAWTTVPQLATLLKQRFGATRVIVFGSLTSCDTYTHWSDIDLAAWGIPPQMFYAALSALNDLSPEIKVDLVDPQRCQSRSIQQAIQQEGIEV